jgi:small-conductance mechanosensitive channel
MNTPGFNMPLFSSGDYTLVLGQVISALVIIIATFLLSAALRKSLKRFLDGNSLISSSQLYVITRFLHYMILITGFVIALSSLGVPMGRLALIASALGVGIGLGLQGIVNNFVSGIVLLLEKSVKVGDFIELASGVVGEVIEIHMRATMVRTNDNVDILVPNAELINNMVTNWTLEEVVRRFQIPFGVAYGSDKALVKKAVLEAANSIEYTLRKKGREPVVWMTGFGDSSLNFTLGVWVSNEQVKRPSSLASDYLWAIDDAFQKYGIEIPFPQRDLHIKSSFQQDQTPSVLEQREKQ